MFDTYEKRDRLSQYKKMNINTDISDSMMPNCSRTDQTHTGIQDTLSPQNFDLKNLKMSKAGLPIAPFSKGMQSSRQLHPEQPLTLG